jgi:hypothetical protein
LGVILIRATITTTLTFPSTEANGEHGMWDGVPILHGSMPSKLAFTCNITRRNVEKPLMNLTMLLNAS